MKFQVVKLDLISI